MSDDTHQISVDTTDAVEMGSVEAGEYKVYVLKAEFREGEGSNGHWEGILLTLDIPDVLEADIFSHMEFLPNKTGTEKQYQRALGNFKKFKEAFGFGPAEPFSVDDLERKEAWAHLTVDSSPQYGDRNKVRNWIVSQG